MSKIKRITDTSVLSDFTFEEINKMYYEERFKLGTRHSIDEWVDNPEWRGPNFSWDWLIGFLAKQHTNATSIVAGCSKKTRDKWQRVVIQEAHKYIKYKKIDNKNA